MSEVHLIIVRHKSMSKRKTEVPSHVSLLSRFSLKIVLVVHDLSASSVPAYVLILALVRAVAEDSHSEIVKTVWFSQIQNIELDLHAFPSVINFEEVPLGVTVSVYIILQNQVILVFADLHGTEQIA